MKKLILKASLIGFSIISLAGCSLLDNINKKKDVGEPQSNQAQEQIQETPIEQKEIIFNESMPLNDTVKTEIQKYKGQEGFLIFKGQEAGLSADEVIVHVGISEESTEGMALDTGISQKGDSAIIYVDEVPAENMNLKNTSQSSTQVLLKGVNPEKVTIKKTDGSNLKSLK